MNDSFRFVRRREVRRRDRRTPRGAAIRPRSPPPSRPRSAARRRVGVSRPRAIDATRRAKHRKIENEPRPRRSRGRPRFVKTLYTVYPHDTKTSRSDTLARRPASSRDPQTRTRARCRATRKKRRRRRWNTARRRVDDDARERSTRARKRENRARGRTTGAGRGRARDRGRGGRRATTEGEGRDGRGRPDDDDDANDGIAMMGTDGARRANRAGFGAGADGERGGRGGAFEGDARARGGEGDEITARSMRLTTMRARWWMFGFTVEDDAV